MAGVSNALFTNNSLEIKAVRVGVGLSPGVADVTLGIEPLRNLHGVMRTHSCNSHTSDPDKRGTGLCTENGTYAQLH